jgi:hypothetical protein
VKITVIPDAGEILEVLRPYLWSGSEITDAEVRDLLDELARCGFVVSHQVDVPDEFVARLERSLTERPLAGRGRPRRVD